MRTQRVADAITDFCGDMKFVYVHTLIFIVWIATAGLGHDRFPFNFLTMAVSLEAIFLSTFILISQNRQQQQAEERQDKTMADLRALIREVLQDEELDIKQLRLLTEGIDMAKKMTRKQDDAYDRKHNIKEGSARDNALDRKRGLKPRKGK